MRYIDADLLREWWLDTGTNEREYNTNDVLNSIDYQPTADVVAMEAYQQVRWERDLAVEQLASYGVCLGEDKELVGVVRCKDCDVPHNKWTGCPNLNGLIPPPDFYCAKGTPKGGGEK